MQTLTNSTVQRWRDNVAEALASFGGECVPVGAEQWQLILPGKKGAGVIGVTLDNAWLAAKASADSPVGGRRGPDASLWDLLLWQPSLPNYVKYSLDQRCNVGARFEMPLVGIDDGNVEERLCMGIDGINAAIAAVRTGKPPAPCSDAQGDPEMDGESLRERCVAGGWAGNLRSNGDLAVALDVPDGFHQAQVRAKNGAIAARTRLVSVDGSLYEPSGQALAVLLLQGAAAVRLIRPYAADAEQRTAAGYEVRLSAGASSDEIACALEALSVACRMCRREAAALLNEQTARAYLAMRGRSPMPTRQ